MPRGGPDIGALLKPDEVREWRSLTVENPKSKPTAAEAATLKEKKAKEKKGKDALLKKVVERINDASIKKDKINLDKDFYVFTGSTVGVVPVLGKGLYTGKIEKLGSVKAIIN